MIKELAQYIDNETEFSLGIDLFAGFRPGNAPDACIAILEPAGGVPDFYNTDYEQKPVQIVSRATNYYTARAQINKIYGLLHGMTGITLPVVVTGDEFFVNTAEGVSAPYYIGMDDKGLFEFSANIVLRYQNA